MTLVDWGTVALLLTGGGFFLSGTIGMLRFPDVLSRLHALTKADNLGLGLVAAGLGLQASTPAVAVKLLLIWLLVLLSSGTSSFLIAREVLAPEEPLPDARDHGRAPS